MHLLEFALKMELDGEKYYMEQAEKFKDTNLHIVFKALARDERKHADIIRFRMDRVAPDLLDSDALDQYRNVFQGAGDFKSAIKFTLDQLDIYYLALEKEQESIDLYKKMLSEAANYYDQRTFQFLIKEEESHLEILDDIVSHVSKARDWVEDAEFGIREEY
ncbi:MAG: ferritin family protein [Clostridiales bacterium]|nr:ferritin family protein [Clostridiales bacterium]